MSIMSWLHCRITLTSYSLCLFPEIDRYIFVYLLRPIYVPTPQCFRLICLSGSVFRRWSGYPGPETYCGDASGLFTDYYWPPGLRWVRRHSGWGCMVGCMEACVCAPSFPSQFYFIEDQRLVCCPREKFKFTILFLLNMQPNSSLGATWRYETLFSRVRNALGSYQSCLVCTSLGDVWFHQVFFPFPLSRVGPGGYVSSISTASQYVACRLSMQFLPSLSLASQVVTNLTEIKKVQKGEVAGGEKSLRALEQKNNVSLPNLNPQIGKQMCRACSKSD